MANTVKLNTGQNGFSSERIMLSPEVAMELLDHNTLNRPLSDGHVKRIANQIAKGRWKFNGDTIKISTDGDILDGQHRLWSCIEAKKPIETIVVRGIPREAFATIDTLTKNRTFSDVVALLGTTRYRNIVGTALSWLLRWQRGVIPTYKQPANRIENSDIEEAFIANPTMVVAVDRACKSRRVCNPAIAGFIYYVANNRNEDLAEKFMVALEDPSGLAVNHPFFQFRSYLTTFSPKNKTPELTIALAFKALNAVAKKRPIQRLRWASQGKTTEPFPKLEI